VIAPESTPAIRSRVDLGTEDISSGLHRNRPPLAGIADPLQSILDLAAFHGGCWLGRDREVSVIVSPAAF
jgi:hypothetical protein